MEFKTYYAELTPDARGFTTFLHVVVDEDNRIISAKLDAYNYDDNPYGDYKSTSLKYNHDMAEESGTYYKDAAATLEDLIVRGRSLCLVPGARALSEDAVKLLADIKKQIS